MLVGEKKIYEAFCKYKYIFILHRYYVVPVFLVLVFVSETDRINVKCAWYSLGMCGGGGGEMFE